ncbi:hypothetical protein SS1G_02142 [Sclerotinia sclerotiorum 1980 UF-70]|uniref:Uncharacterized protein n=2 Tax=Sclerotinia sclerotiorum (strain ATCC 18683 / 1980 / Ss-1) TaxID=665079 RepID=A7EA12_SCLS1|nr:hypothetical protein SS1G_02142 [Sclerotinia sclerotiorum 1980 UF-70]APA08455.1 hypothetical protein sscle_04g032250 [Sclerotinia sclerotiorum 1980 UF-70]EDN99290.1 hypothetical protein SS1G_02142 [Sclerotinia sclerotiorum 1980 UF-70]
MADVRSLLKNERAARRIQHKHAGYSTAGALMCLVCHLQMKSESLWEGHLRSPGHVMRLSKQEADRERNARADTNGSEEINRKRKADDEDEDIDYGSMKKRSKATTTAMEGFFVPATETSKERSESPSKSAIPHDMQIPSRPATPAKPIKSPPPVKQATVDEDEWAAFEADIAAADVPAEIGSEAIISAPAMTTAEVEARSAEEDKKHRKEKLEAELEGDKEDAERKLQEEFEEMESLEQRVKRLREKREALRSKEREAGATESMIASSETPEAKDALEDDDEEEDDDDEDDWDGFRLR